MQAKSGARPFCPCAKQTTIIEGRGFEAPEYANGEDVVSATYAMKNGLSVGQELELDLYRSKLTTRLVAKEGLFASYKVANVHEPCKEENRLGIKRNYRIVGIYSAPEFETGEISFYADTIFVPKASVPNAANYEVLGNRLLYSVILENGKATSLKRRSKRETAATWLPTTIRITTSWPKRLT